MFIRNLFFLFVSGDDMCVAYSYRGVLALVLAVDSLIRAVSYIGAFFKLNQSPLVFDPFIRFDISNETLINDELKREYMFVIIIIIIIIVLMLQTKMFLVLMLFVIRETA